MHHDIGIIGLGQMGNYYGKLADDLGLHVIGTDISVKKMQEFLQKYPQFRVAEGVHGILQASPSHFIVTSNTPSHESNISDIIDGGGGSILAEKPLAMTLDQVRKIVEKAKKNDVEVYTAFLIAFSPVIEVLREFMQSSLVVVSGDVDWGKNRIGNHRPTAGNLEDESVHGAHILRFLTGINQQVETTKVHGVTLGYSEYVDPRIQNEAHRQDASFPLRPNSDTMVTTTYTTSRVREVSHRLKSSFIAPTQRRRVTLTLADITHTNKPLYSVELNFDGKGGDSIGVYDLQANSKEVLQKTLSNNKLLDQLLAFIDTKKGGSDPRLTDLEGALEIARWTDAVIQSYHEEKAILID